MYVTTFYSFKGGVGRTMALVNVAVDLARQGRRVLAVDFDLEAPGLDTFDLPRPRAPSPGIIDFVNAFLATGHAPNVEDYLFESLGVANGDGNLWIMPSGAHQDSYAANFAQIDWGTLYDKHDGYLLFEDVKEQWRSCIQPDYVLIDSRTGHTDVGGICTRQLPDAVVVLFFPNAQNLRGLTKVVRDIRAEGMEPRNRAIDLHFVMSNVPDLDDEDKILERIITSFQTDLGFENEPLVIHRYDSLSLLNQVIFTKDRPRSRLAKEYRGLTSEIIRGNLEDRVGALDYITRMQIRSIPGEVGQSPEDVDTHLKKIETNHRADGEVLFRLGALRADDGFADEAVGLFTKAIELGYPDPEVYLRRAHIRRSDHNDHEGASRDAMEALCFSDASRGQVRRAFAMLAQDQRMSAAISVAVTALEPRERVWIASELNGTRIDAATAVAMISPLLIDDHLPKEALHDARQALVLSYIALGRFYEALEAIRNEEPDVSRMRIYFAFNFGMALWGQRSQVVREPFDRVLEIERSNPQEDPDANFYQCMAIANWAVGDTDRAREAAKRARQIVGFPSTGIQLLALPPCTRCRLRARCGPDPQVDRGRRERDSVVHEPRGAALAFGRLRVDFVMFANRISGQALSRVYEDLVSTASASAR